MRIKTIELDVYNTSLTAALAIEKGKEFTDAIDIAMTINMLIFKQTDNKTEPQIRYILGDIKRFVVSLEMELLEQKRRRLGRNNERI